MQECTALSFRPALVVAVALLAMPARANPPLGEVSVVTEGLIAAAIAYEIGDRCESLDARILAGIAFLHRLKTHAASLGYTAAEIDAFIDNGAEADRLEAIARARLAEKGGVAGDWATYCAVGQAEIAAGSQIGRLLR